VADAGAQPAITLLDFFNGLATADGALRASGGAGAEAGGMAALAIAKAQAASAAFRGMPTLEERDVGLWVKYWKSKGLFEDV
jgi:hypothetical protein